MTDDYSWMDDELIGVLEGKKRPKRRWWAVAARPIPPGATGTGPPPTWNPADTSAGITLSNGNLTATAASGSDIAVRATKGYSASKVFWEINIGSGTWGSDTGYGFANSGAVLTNVANSATGAVMCYSTNWWYNGAGHGTGLCPGGGVNTNITIMVAVDMTNHLWWAQSSNNPGNWNISSGPGTANPATGTGGLDYTPAGLDATLYPVVSFQNSLAPPITLNTTGPFVLTPPAGFSPLT